MVLKNTRLKSCERIYTIDFSELIRIEQSSAMKIKPRQQLIVISELSNPDTVFYKAK